MVLTDFMSEEKSFLNQKDKGLKDSGMDFISPITEKRIMQDILRAVFSF